MYVFHSALFAVLTEEEMLLDAGEKKKASQGERQSTRERERDPFESLRGEGSVTELTLLLMHSTMPPIH